MAENPQAQNQEEEAVKIFNDMPEDRTLVVFEKFLERMPKVFIDGHGLVKISLIRNFTNCTEYISRSGLTFEGCFIYENGELKKTRGIYLTPPPIISIKSRRKMAYNIEEIRERIKSQLEFTNNHIKSLMESNRWLIKYDNWSISIYDKAIKGKILKFPLMVQQGHLYISMPPRIPIQLLFERVREIQIYNHTIKFQREVVRFKGIYSFGGVAELIYNDSGEYTRMEITSEDHEGISTELKPKRLILLTHPRPQESID
jgi:hypothetical protein